MILEKEVEIRNNPKIKSFYKNIGLDVSGKYIKVPLELLSKTSKVKITAICDVCTSKVSMCYYTYIIQTKYDGLKYCEKCSTIKRKKTIKEKYGVESYTQTQEFKEKTKISCLNHYGTEFYQSSNDYKSKIIKTCIEKYGVTNYAITDECKLKMEKTRIKNGNQLISRNKKDYEMLS